MIAGEVSFTVVDNVFFGRSLHWAYSASFCWSDISLSPSAGSSMVRKKLSSEKGTPTGFGSWQTPVLDKMGLFLPSYTDLMPVCLTLLVWRS